MAIYTTVALLAEGVDRNSVPKPHSTPHDVALLAEGVDRNRLCSSPLNRWNKVALLAEGVDRNYCTAVVLYAEDPSPSSRRAWIEIMMS